VHLHLSAKAKARIQLRWVRLAARLMFLVHDCHNFYLERSKRFF